MSHKITRQTTPQLGCGRRCLEVTCAEWEDLHELTKAAAAAISADKTIHVKNTVEDISDYLDGYFLENFARGYMTARNIIPDEMNNIAQACAFGSVGMHVDIGFYEPGTVTLMIPLRVRGSFCFYDKGFTGSAVDWEDYNRLDLNVYMGRRSANPLPVVFDQCLPHDFVSYRRDMNIALMMGVDTKEIQKIYGEE